MMIGKNTMTKLKLLMEKSIVATYGVVLVGINIPIFNPGSY